MKRLLVVLLLALGLPAIARAYTPGTAVHAANNAALQGMLSTVGQVVRDGYTVAGDAPPLSYTPSNAPCSLNSGGGDGGSQVPTADGKCWIANFGAAADIREWGAKPDDTTDDTSAINAAINWQLTSSSAGGGNCAALLWGDSSTGGAYKVTSDIIVDINNETANCISDGLKWIVAGGTDLDGTSITSTPTLEFRCGTTSTVPNGCNNVVIGQGGRLTVKGANSTGPVVRIGLPPTSSPQDLFSGGTWDYITPQNWSTSTTGCGIQINKVLGAHIRVMGAYDAGAGTAGQSCSGVEITGAQGSQIDLYGTDWGGASATGATQVALDGTAIMVGNDIGLYNTEGNATGDVCLSITDANAAFNRFYADFRCPIDVYATTGNHNLLVNPSFGSGTHYGSQVGVTSTTETNSAYPAISNPTGTTSTSGVMMGLRATFTPVYSGAVRISLAQNCSIGSGTFFYQLRYGTGSAPVNGAAPTGTAVGGAGEFSNGGSSLVVPCGQSAIVYGLSAGTAYWFDEEVTSSGATATVSSINLALVEQQ